MNIEHFQMRSGSVIALQDASLTDLAQALADEARNLSRLPATRTAELRDLDLRIAGYLQGSGSSSKEACLLLTGILDLRVRPLDLINTARLQAHAPQLEPLITSIARHSRAPAPDAAASAQAMAQPGEADATPPSVSPFPQPGPKPRPAPPKLAPKPGRPASAASSVDSLVVPGTGRVAQMALAHAQRLSPAATGTAAALPGRAQSAAPALETPSRQTDGGGRRLVRPAMASHQTSQVAKAAAQFESRGQSASPTVGTQGKVRAEARGPWPSAGALAALQGAAAMSGYAASQAGARTSLALSYGSSHVAPNGPRNDAGRGAAAPAGAMVAPVADDDADAAYARALQMQETHDSDLAAQWQRDEDDAYRSGGRAHGSVVREAQKLGRDAVPAALVNPATQALYVHACFDTVAGQTIDGPVDVAEPRPAHHIDDHALNKALQAWAHHRTQEDVVLIEALCEALMCPLTQALFVKPVIAVDGHTYEAEVIVEWLELHGTSPVTGEALSLETLWPAETLAALMRQYGMMHTPFVHAAGEGPQMRIVAAVAAMASSGEANRQALVQAASASLTRACYALDISAATLAEQVLSVTRLCHSQNRFDRACGEMAAPAAIATLQQFIDVVDTEPLQCLLILHAADLHRFIKHYRQAATLARRVVGLMPDNVKAMTRLALLCAMSGKLDEADDWAQAPGAADLDRVTLLAARGEICRRRGQYGQALQYFADAQAEPGYKTGLFCPPEVTGLQKLAFKQKAGRGEA